MSSQESYLTNSLKETHSYTILAQNSRARIEQCSDGNKYIVVDGVKYPANDLFGMNENLTLILDVFTDEYDMETKKEEFNANYEKRIADIDKKMDENKAEAKSLREIQERIKKAITSTCTKLRNFLKECGVSLISSLFGKNRAIADNMNAQIWGNKFARVFYSNNEMDCYTANNYLAFEKGKAMRDNAFNNVLLER